MRQRRQLGTASTGQGGKSEQHENHQHSLRSASLVFVAALATFVNSIPNEFVFDDQPAILWNKDVLGNSSWSDLFLNDYWGERMSSYRSHGSYRPLTVLTFRINHALFGLSPSAFHLVNVLLHAISSALLHEVLDTFLPNQRIALVASLLFAVHPIHCEAVASVVGRADVLAAILFWLSLLTFARAVGLFRLSTAPQSPYPMVLVSGAMCVLAMLCKETGITAIGVIIAFDAFFVARIDRLWCHGKIEMSEVVALVKRAAVLVGVGVCALACRLSLMASQPVFSPQHNPAAEATDRTTRWLSLTFVAAYNAWLLVWPLRLSCDWSMGSIPLIDSILDPRNLWSLAVIATLAWLTAKSLAPTVQVQVRDALRLGLVLMVVPFIPASNLFFKVGFVVAERVVYIPSAGFCVLLSLLISRLFRNEKQRNAFAAILLVALFARSAHRNFDWCTEEQLFSSSLVAAPLNAKLHYDYAKVVADKQPPSEENDGISIRHYKKAIFEVPWPGYSDPAFNLGNLYSRRQNTKEAMAMWHKALEINPRHVNSLVNIATVLGKQGDMQGERDYLMRALAINPDNSHALSNYGVWLMAMNDLAASEQVFQRLLALDPNFEVGKRRYADLLETKRRRSRMREMEFIYVVPPTARPGDKVQVVAPNGQKLDIVIPDYAAPGHRLTLTVS